MKHFGSYHETVWFKRRNTLFHPVEQTDTSHSRCGYIGRGLCLFVNESDFFCIMIIGRFPITIFSKDLLHLLLHFRRKMFLPPMYTVIGSTVAQNIHDAVLDGLHFDMFYLVVEMGKSPCCLELVHTHEMRTRCMEVSIGINSISGSNIIGFELCRDESDAFCCPRTIGIEAVHPMIIYQTFDKRWIIKI